MRTQNYGPASTHASAYRTDRAVAINVEQETTTIAPHTISVHAGVRGSAPRALRKSPTAIINAQTLYQNDAGASAAPRRRAQTRRHLSWLSVVTTPASPIIHRLSTHGLPIQTGIQLFTIWPSATMFSRWTRPSRLYAQPLVAAPCCIPVYQTAPNMHEVD